MGKRKFKRSGGLAILPRGVRFFCVEPHACLWREMQVATWAYVFGWCSYRPEPMLLETWGRACVLGEGGSQAIRQSRTEPRVWKPSTSIQTPAPSLTGCATLIKPLILSEPPYSQRQKE